MCRIPDDQAHAEKKSFERLKAELAHARAAPASSYKPPTAADAIARHQIRALLIQALS